MGLGLSNSSPLLYTPFLAYSEEQLIYGIHAITLTKVQFYKILSCYSIEAITSIPETPI